MTNYEKYFGTPELAAASMAGQLSMSRAFGRWAENGGALLCALVGRGSGKTGRAKNAFREWLESEADHD